MTTRGTTQANPERTLRLHIRNASTETRGHGTTGNAKFYSELVRQLLQTIRLFLNRRKKLL